MHVEALRPAVKVISPSPPSSSSSSFAAAAWTSSEARARESEQRQPAAGFNREWVRRSEGVSGSKLFCEQGAVWMSVIQLNKRSAFPGCWCCACLWVCVIIRFRQGCMFDCQVCSSHVRVCVCVLTGRVAGHRALLTGELLRHWLRCHQGEQTGALYREPWDTLPQHCHHY